MIFRMMFLTVLIALSLTVAGCAAPVRYSFEEIKGFPPGVQDMIIKGEIALGMSKQQVRYAWGSPQHVRVLDPLVGKLREEWTYTKFGMFEDKKLLFIDEKLVYISPELQK
ncbi:MAG: hypothetical protein L0Y62_04745 [Nitrospirae bacterium]|nr:hypothetical protein [Nitrospirota bacterium]